MTDIVPIRWPQTQLAVLLMAYLIAWWPRNSVAQEGQPIRLVPGETVSVPSEFRLPGTPPVYPVLWAETAPTIDGQLDEPVWQAVPRLGRMYLDSGLGPMKFDTVARLARDEHYLYLGVQCFHPQISEVPVGKGIRDKVAWAGETVEVFLDVDRSAKGYVQVIFDMSGALTDMYDGHPKWDGDIHAATDVGGDGWRLEARLKIADLGGGGKTDRLLWGANVARNTRGQSGSWARIAGNYQQPELFGLLTLAGKGLSVEDVGLGVFALPSDKAKRIPLRLRLRNLTAEPKDHSLTCELLPSGDKPAAGRRTIHLNASESQSLAISLDLGAAEKVRVEIAAGPDAAQVFRADLPVKRLAIPPDCLVTPDVTCAVRAAAPIALNKDDAKVYLMAQSLVDDPRRWSGKIVVHAADEDRSIWQSPVQIDLPPGGAAARLVSLPTERLRPGRYVVEWMPDAAAEAARISASVDYIPALRKRLRELLVPARAKDVLTKLGCAFPEDPRDHALVQVKIDRMAACLAEETDNIEIDLTGRIVKNYRQLSDAVARLKETGRYSADRRGWHESAIYSPVDGSAQPFSVFVPHDFDLKSGRMYPLCVFLHGAGSTHAGEAGFEPGRDRHIVDRFQLHPLGRGRFCGYGGVPGNDVVNQIRAVMRSYPIDHDAVHLAGGSMGGFGSFEIGSKYPDMFATCMPLAGGGFWAPLEQMRNLPTYVHHGLSDLVVKPLHAILAAAKMDHHGCPVQLYLHPGVGHGAGEVANTITTWETLKPIRRDRDPRTVVLSGALIALKKAYWLAICRCVDPHSEAYLRATFVGHNHLSVVARNVAWMKVALPTQWLDPDAPLQITLGDGRKWTEIKPGEAKAVYIRLDGENLEATTDRPKKVGDPTVYLGGGPARLLEEGRALRIVCGTGGSPEQTAALAKLAKELRTWPSNFEVGGYPVLKDTEVRHDTLSGCDLILLGSPAENALIAQMANDLPLEFSAGTVTVKTTPPMQWAEDAVSFSLYYRNPLAPARRIWWFVGADTVDELGKLAPAPGNLLGADLLIRSRDKQRVLAAARIVGDWKLARIAPLKPANSLWPSPRKLHEEFSAAVKAAFPVDISLLDVSDALWQGDQIDWDSLTVGEALALLGHGGSMIVSVSGSDLIDWRKSVTEKAEGKSFDLSWTGLEYSAVTPDQTYHVLAGWEVASQLEPEDQSFRDIRLVPALEYDALAERFRRGYVDR